MSPFDVAVIGGGPAGSATALGLVHRGLSVVLLERSPRFDVRVGETLPPAIKVPLGELRVWERFLAEGHERTLRVRSVWGRDTPHENDHLYNPYGAGWHVDRARFDTMLVRAAEERGAEVVRDARTRRFENDAAGAWTLHLGDGRAARPLRARFLVDATGRLAAVARRFGATRAAYDRLVGAVMFLERTPDPADYTLIEATQEGWWYTAALPNRRTVVAYMTDADLYARASRRAANPWRDRMREAPHTRARIGADLGGATPKLVAAHSSRLGSVAGDNWLAVGDAAAALDPLSSQGIYKALQCGLLAADAIRRHFDGDARSLDRYQRTVEAQFSTYLRQRSAYYRMEARWPDSPFWRRRHAA